MTEHTDPKALEALWNRSVVEPIGRPRWYARLWAWLEDWHREPVVAVPVPDLVARRIRVYRVGTRYARRLSRIDAGEAREILSVAAMLLGFETQSSRRVMERAARR